MTTVDETAFTTWAEPGWEAWNAMSPEVDFCRFVGMLARMLQPAVTVETGVGAGKVTEQLDRQRTRWLGFEADTAWRPEDAQDAATPSAEQMTSAELVILDSDPNHRFNEIACWVTHGRPDSVCVIHDAGNGHPDYYNHQRIREAILRTGIPGMFLRNPRGGWVGIHP
jgi:hypothetical protein